MAILSLIERGIMLLKIIRFHSCLGCPKMNYYLNNTFVLTALDMGKERGAKQLMVCKKKDGGCSQRGLGQEGGGDSPPADDQ